MTLRVVGWAAVSSGVQAEDDKISIPYQIERINEIVKANGWKLIDLIIVPGFSREYFSYEEFAADASNNKKDPIKDPLRLIDHWTKKDFDVFMYFAADRFGRTQSILAQVAERTVYTGARLFSMQMNRLLQPDETPFYIATEGLRSAGEVRELRRRYDIGMTNRAARGLPNQGRVLPSHIPVRNDKGYWTHNELDESLRPFWDEVFRIIVRERVAFRNVEKVLAERGYTTINGEPLYPQRIHATLQSPSFWGHSARKVGKANRGRSAWQWVYRDDIPAPPGVLLFRNTQSPVYTGKQREELIMELDRRLTTSKGKSHSYRSNRYAGLLICKSCGRRLIYIKRKNQKHTTVYLYCAGPYSANPTTCANRKVIHAEYIDAYVDAMLKLIFSMPDTEDALRAVNLIDDVDNMEVRADQLLSAVQKLEDRARRLIKKQANAPDSLASIYDNELNIIGEELANRQAQLAALHAVKPGIASQVRTVDEIRQIGIEGFWKLSDPQINQHLSGLLGDLRFEVEDGKITHFTDTYFRR